MIGRAARKLDTVQHRYGVFLAIDGNDLEPAAIAHGYIKAIGERNGSGTAEIQQGGEDPRTFRGAGAGTGNHGPIALDIGRPSAAVDIEISEEPALSLQITFDFGEPGAGTRVEIVGNVRRGLCKKRCECERGKKHR